jgi:probable HAF family extracellular repeat protein
MTTIRLAGTILFASLLIGAGLSSVTTAKKPGTEPPPPPPPPPVAYHLTWLGDFGGYTTEALGVNASGIVVGYSTDGAGDRRAFVCLESTTGAILDLTTLAVPADPEDPLYGAILTTAVCINNDGRIAGNLIDGQGNVGVYVYDPPAVSGGQGVLQTPSFVSFEGFAADRMWVADLTENGDVLGGFSYPDRGGRRCFVWQSGTAPIIIHNLCYPEEPYEPPTFLSAPEAMNDDLTIVGMLPTKNSWQAFRWQLTDTTPGGEVWATDLEMLPGEMNVFGGIDINNAGVVSGSIIARGSARPATYASVDWELLAGNYSQTGFSKAINDAGQICGELKADKFHTEENPGFVFDEVSGFWSLRELVVSEDEADLHLWFDGQSILDSVRPQDISDLPDATSDGWGIIVGYKRFWGDHWWDVWADGQSRRLGFVLIPQ